MIIIQESCSDSALLNVHLKSILSWYSCIYDESDFFLMFKVCQIQIHFETGLKNIQSCCFGKITIVFFNEGGHVYEDSEDEGEDGPSLVQIPVHEKQGAPMKDWDSLGPLQKRRVSQRAFDELKRTAKARNINPQRLAGSILHR